MGNHPPFLDGSFTAADIFQDRQFFVQPLESLDIDQVGSRPPVLGDENRVSVLGHGGNNIRGLALQRRYQFNLHE